MLIKRKAFSQAGIITTGEIDLCAKYLGWNSCNSLELITNFPTKEYVRRGGYYKAEGVDLWNYLVKPFGVILEKMKINSYSELERRVIDWTDRYRDR